MSAPIILHPSATARIEKLLAKQPEWAVFRIAVSGGGCSGFSYQFAIKPTPEADDLILEHGNFRVAIDPMALQFINGAELEFVDDLMGTYFRMNNPNATASCGCGTSFSVM